jgi:hydroxymethylpyrimidine pyrophosphatase-like HAD family hydrolase
MNIFDELEVQYHEIDNQYSSIEFDCIRRGWNRKEQKYKRKREINDQAYFVFMFSRLEDRIREESAKLIRKKKSTISSWKQKASWEILPSQPDAELHFKKRLALGC